MKLQFDKNHFFALVISLVLFGIFVIMHFFTTILDSMEMSAIDFRFYMRSPFQEVRSLSDKVTISRKNPNARDDVVIVAIDEDTIKTFLEEEDMRWPFPWDMHKTITRYIAADNPSAIFFDVMFIDNLQEKTETVSRALPSVNVSTFNQLPYDRMKSVFNPVNFHWFRAQEKEFARTIQQAGCVFLDYPFFTEETFKTYTDIGERMQILSTYAFPVPKQDIPVEPCGRTMDPRCPWVKDAVPPTPLLSRAAKGIGFANVRADNDKVNRRVPLVIKFKQNGQWGYYPGIDLLLAMNYYGIGKKDVDIRMGEYVALKNLPTAKMKKPNAAREIRIPVDHEGFMDINYIGGPGSFDTKSYYYFNRPPEGRGNFRNKIVFIAAYSVTGISSDVHKSPFGDTFGVEHHANAINTILNQDFMVRLTETQNMVILLVIALLFGLVLSRISIIKSTLFTVIIGIGYMVAAVILFDTVNLICVFATPVMQIGATFTFITVFRVFTEQREKRFIRQTFSKFVSKEVVDVLLQNPEGIKLGGDKMILTVLFSDIRGFTTISEALTPEALVDHLNEYLQAMTDIVFKYNGTLDKYVGDEIMAFWGAPIPQEDHALLACKASVEMMEVLGQLNEKWVSQGKPRLDIGIGLNSGEMVVGNMGSHSRMDYTLMGDNVNLGARLEGTNKVYGTHIIISEFTFEHVKDRIAARELDLIRVKGKELPVKIYELIEVKE